MFITPSLSKKTTLRIKKRGYEFIVITNQGGIAKEIYGHKEVHILHTFMRKQLEQAGITLLAIYYCPHHTSYGKCICRKPNSLLLEKAIAKYEVAIESSYFIGDSERDIEAGNRAGLKSILIKSNDNLTHYLNQID